MPPPGLAPAPTRCESASGKPRTSGDAALTRRYVHIALSDPACAGISVHRVSKIVRRFIAAGRHERDLVEWVTSYADPTARQAIRNVDRERGW